MQQIVYVQFFSLSFKNGLIKLLVLVFWPTHENGPALLKQNKIVLQLSFLLNFSSYPLFYPPKTLMWQRNTYVAVPTGKMSLKQHFFNLKNQLKHFKN